MTNNTDVNNIEWEDIVVAIPKNTVHMIIQTSVFNNGKIVKYQGEYDVNGINDCKNTLEKYIDGDLPLYVLTEKGKIMEVYESHMGGIYFDEEVLDYDYLYCEQCGDSDTHLGHADTWEDVIPMLMWSWEEDEYKYDQDYINKLKLEFETLIEDK